MGYKFTFWFKPNYFERDIKSWQILDSDGSRIGSIDESKEPNDISINDNCPEALIWADFDEFKKRPEYIMHEYSLRSWILNSEDLSKTYDKLLESCIYCIENKINETEVAEKMTNRALEWLHTTDFYTSPASTRFHEAYDGGLLEHTLNVVVELIELHNVHAFRYTDLARAIECALVHDWCKIGKYESYMRNVKNESTGVWEQVKAYRVNEGIKFSFGHGVASMYIASTLLKLNKEQKLAIRWHMGRWYVADDEINDLQYSNEVYPMVHMLQFADQLAITRYNTFNL